MPQMDYDALIRAALAEPTAVMPEDRMRALRRQQSVGLLGTMAGGELGKFGQSLYGSAQGQLAADTAQRGKGLDRAVKAVGLAKGLRDLKGGADWDVVSDGQGGFMKFNKVTGQVLPMAGVTLGGGGEIDYSAPPPQFGKMSEQQQKQYKFGKESAQAIGRMMKSGDFQPNLADRKFLMSGGEGVVGMASAYAASPEGRQYMNDARNAVANIVYGKSGAQVTESEWQRAVPIYVPMPWDTEAERGQKLHALRSQALTMSEVTGPASQWLRGYMLDQFSKMPSGQADDIIELGD